MGESFKKSEAADVRTLFNSIIQSSADAIIASDLDKRIIYFSKGAEAMFEQKSDDVLGTDVLRLYSREDMKKEERIKRAKELKKNGSVRNITLNIRTPSDTRKKISLTLSLLKDEKGRITGTVGVAKDITKEMEVFDETRYLKELNEQVFEGIPEGLISMDQKQMISLVNRGFERITGFRKDDTLGKTVDEFCENPEAAKLIKKMGFNRKFSRIMTSGGTIEPKGFSITIHGRKKVFTDYWTALHDREGRVEHILIILRDMTRRARLEKSLREQAKNLKHSNELKDLFSDILRHDLINPIGIIKNCVELMHYDGIDPVMTQCFDAVSKNTSKAMEMINTTARFAKIDDEKEIVFEGKDIVTILVEAVESSVHHANKKDIKIETKLPESYRAFVNPFIEDVFINLISNALKYSPENKTVTVELKESDGMWRISVKDQGEGVPDKYKKSIFNRFERLKKEGVKGTGLGLAIVKKIVSMHKGNVWVEDNPEGGSIFIVEIPKDL